MAAKSPCQPLLTLELQQQRPLRHHHEHTNPAGLFFKLDHDVLESDPLTSQRKLAFVKRLLGGEGQRRALAALGIRKGAQAFKLDWRANAGPQSLMNRGYGFRVQPDAAHAPGPHCHSRRVAIRVRNAADDSRRPEGQPVLPWQEREALDSKLLQRPPRAQPSGRKITYALFRTVAYRVYLILSQIPGRRAAVQLGGDCPGGEERGEFGAQLGHP